MRSLPAILLLAALPAAATEVRCTADYALASVTLAARPTKDPYAFETSDALDRFRLSIQLLEKPGKLKTWIYQTSEGKQVLVHMAEYPFDAASCRQYEQGFGLHRVYSSPMERELVMQCKAICNGGSQ